ncbi:MAG TPA: glutamate--tRNA ligase, partial [Lentisphaeria bacterium]|nr:glutamate--tRNA ligase [Lentisphaeria bacterium]
DDAVVAALRSLPAKLASVEPFTAAALEEVIAAAAAVAGVAPGKLNQPLRAAVTGSGIGAGIFETIEVIGKERTLARLQAEQWLPQK